MWMNYVSGKHARDLFLHSLLRLALPVDQSIAQIKYERSSVKEIKPGPTNAYVGAQIIDAELVRMHGIAKSILVFGHYYEIVRG